MTDDHVVVISDAPEMDYLHDFACLPPDFGSEAYFSRPDVQAIRATVFNCLDELDRQTGFSTKIKDRRILVKPNLVSVYSRLGFKDEHYPETTDPRVFEAVIAYLIRYSRDIVIVESSGEGMPTRVSYKLSGLDRLARHYGIRCVALELEPAVRYMLPGAEVMKEILIPRILDEVVQGRAFYVSVPKMKTNLYTGVTLGFKNAMGIIPYKLRQRNHTYQIHKKLVDMLCLFKPDLTVIDGIIGGEGNTPAPVDPVRVGVIIASNHSVAADRVATRMMGIDPDRNPLLAEAVRRGFDDPAARVIGNQKVVPFRQANSSLMDAEFQRYFPGVKTLVGYELPRAPVITDLGQVTPELVLEMEKACDGGCLPATKTAFEYMKYTPNFDRNFSFALIMGNGAPVNGLRYYFDADGKAYTPEMIRELGMKRLTIGRCTAALKEFCEVNGEGCCSPGSCLMSTYRAAGRTVPALTSGSRHRTLLLYETVRLYLYRKWMVIRGIWLDVPCDQSDRIHELPPLDEQQASQAYIPWPLPAMTPADRMRLWKDVKLIFG